MLVGRNSNKGKEKMGDVMRLSRATSNNQDAVQLFYCMKILNSYGRLDSDLVSKITKQHREHHGGQISGWLTGRERHSQGKREPEREAHCMIGLR